MSNFNVNINVDDILSQKEAETVRVKPNIFDIKNYLQARLGDNEDSKEITIRLLPFTPEGGSPFHKVHMHNVRVNKEVSPSGWKRFPCPVQNKLGDACPFCETALQAKELKKTALTEAERKKYEEIEYMNYAKDMWIVRCIERGHEEDGVKFWLFNDSKKKDGVYDKIFAIFKKRYEKGKNIFDLKEGKDLCLTLTKDSMGRTSITVTDDDEYTPLTDNTEQGLAWIADTKKWNDVYTVKNYDFMSIIVQGGIPYYDKTKGTYVEKSAFEAKENAEIEANLTRQTVDFSTPQVAQVPSRDVVMATVIEDKVDDDLPF